MTSAAGERKPGSSATSRDMTYHYVGKVHVRGLLRRVWRPRYLALGDDGYLRYHESLPPLYQQDIPHPNRQHNPNSALSTTNASHGSHALHNHHTHRPKSILKILDGARTIDPHSVVDQHVALPEGVYGFVFRGRAIELHPTDSTNGNEGIDSVSVIKDDGVVIVPHQGHDGRSTASKPLSTSKQMVNLVFPKGTARRGIAQKIAKQAINPDVLCGFGRTHNCDGGISRSSSSSSLFDANGNNNARGDGIQSNNREWGHDSYGSQDTIGSFQDVGRHVVERDLEGDFDGMSVRKATSIQFQVQAASIQSREYLCAVSTAEEAESWVVALRWAAEHRRRRRYASSVNSVTAALKQENDDRQDGKSDNCRNTVNSITPKRRGHNGDGFVEQPIRDVESTVHCTAESPPNRGTVKKSSMSAAGNNVAEPTTSSKLDSSSPHRSSSASSATIVVTKVSTLRLPTNSLMHLECNNHYKLWPSLHIPLPGDDLVLYYEIQLLLLKHCKPLNDIAVHPESVEERTIMKSIHDMLAFVRDLMTEFSADDSRNLSEVDGKRNNYMSRRVPNEATILLEDVKSELLACMEQSGIKLGSPQQPSNRGSMLLNCTIAELSSTFTEAMASIEVVDRVMRKLSKDGKICSSIRFREFLGLHTTHNNVLSPSHSNAKKKSQTMVSKEADAEQIVRSWLSKRITPSTRTKVEVATAITLRHWAAGPMLSLIVLWSTCRIASIFWLIISGTDIVVSIPLETYVTLVAIAFYFGRNQGLSSQRGTEKLELIEFSNVGLASASDDHSTVAEKEDSESEDDMFAAEQFALSSPLPLYPANNGISCWSNPDHKIFMVRSTSYFEDRVKVPSAPAVFQCRGVDVWLTDNAERNIARHPAVLGGELHREDTFVVNFLLPFSNFVAYFTVPPIEEMPSNVAKLWTEFVKGDQQFRDGKLKLLPVVVDGPWIVKKAVGPGTSPAMVGRDLPLQYYFTEPTATRKGIYEVDVLVTASRIARGILNVVKGHTKSITMAFAFIIEASEEAQLPERVLCAFQCHSLHLEECPNLPDCYPDG
ncbi:hypothetical protein ACHAWU_008492 [Discostella pseudostelligera]|uniref:Protein ENHANCED DISEASE RESISTANCE 2 C-terminal domain-containing protein n=1 Tax=Discostella pseudostelligera TaxID=259834 RepID=A0ABD3M3L4_9STRA